MAWETPFLTLELRRRSYRFRHFHLAALGSGLVFIPVALAVVGRALHLSEAMAPLVQSMLVVLLSCGAFWAGATAGRAIFTVEWREGTLDDLRLLPISPGVWLTQKLLPAFYLVLLHAGATVPLLLLAVVLDAIPASIALAAVRYAFGLSFLWLAICLPVDRTQTQPGASAAQPEAGCLVQVGLVALLGPRALLGLGLPLLILGSGPRGQAEQLRFFSGHLSFWLVLGLLLMTAFLAAYGSGSHTLLETARTRVIAYRLAWLGFAVDLPFFLGLGWNHLPARWIAGLLLASSLLSLLPRQRPERQRTVNPHLEAELVWLEARWSNPIFLHDLRRLFRHASMRGWLFRSALGLTVIVSIVLLLSNAIGWNLLKSPGTWGGSVVFFIVMPLISVGAAALGRWNMERLRGEFREKALTPLTSREWLLGRSAAGVLYHLVTVWVLWLAMAMGLVWLCTTPAQRVVIPLLLIGFLIILWMGTATTFPRTSALDPELDQQLALQRQGVEIGYWVLFLFSVGLFFVSAVGVTEGWIVSGLCLLCLFPALRLVQNRFEQSVRELDLMRSGAAEWKQPLPGEKK